MHPPGDYIAPAEFSCMNYHATKSLTRLNIANLTLGEEISFKERIRVQTQQVIGRARAVKASQFLEKTS
jgi:hypothetical protein